MKRSLVVAAAVSTLGVALLATALGYGVDRDRYVAANTEIFAELPHYPGARHTAMRSSAYHASEAVWSPVAGYTTLAFYELPSDTDPDAVATFYERALTPEWTLVGRLTSPPDVAGPVLNFERGDASLSVNLESHRGGILEIAIDHRRGR